MHVMNLGNTDALALKAATAQCEAVGLPVTIDMSRIPKDSASANHYKADDAPAVSGTNCAGPRREQLAD